MKKVIQFSTFLSIFLFSCYSQTDVYGEYGISIETIEVAELANNQSL